MGRKRERFRRRRLQTQKRNTGVMEIESRIPSPITSDITKYEQYMLENLDVLFNFYGFTRAKERFNLYQGRQRAVEYMAPRNITGLSEKRKRARKKERSNNQDPHQPLTKSKQTPPVIIWSCFGSRIIQVILWKSSEK